MSGPRHILVIDDDPVICDLLADILAVHYDVSTECDPRAGLENIDCNVLDLLIIDLNMPMLNGEEIIPQIRAQSSCRRLPIIVLSAYNDAPRRVAGLDVQAVMSKPFVLEKFIHTVESLLPPRDTSRQA